VTDRDIQDEIRLPIPCAVVFFTIPFPGRSIIFNIRLFSGRFILCLAAGGRNPPNVSDTAIIIDTWYGAISRFINFADNIPKPGGLLEYDGYEDDAENGDRDDHVNDA